MLSCQITRVWCHSKGIFGSWKNTLVEFAKDFFGNFKGVQNACALGGALYKAPKATIAKNSVFGVI